MLDVIYVIAHIILAMTAKLLKLRVKVKPEWFELRRTKFDWQSHNFSEVTKILFRSAASSQDSEIMVLSTSTTSKCVEVQMKGVPIRGIIDTGSDITILCISGNCHNK